MERQTSIKRSIVRNFLSRKKAFSVRLIFSYKLDPLVQELLPHLTPCVAEMYRNVGDYMKIGEWMMLYIDSEEVLGDYLKLITVKLISGENSPHFEMKLLRERFGFQESDFFVWQSI